MYWHLLLWLSIGFNGIQSNRDNNGRARNGMPSRTIINDADRGTSGPILAQQKEDCVCVPTNLCDSNYNVIQAGEGLIDERIGGLQIDERLGAEPPKTKCSNPQEICCRLRDGTSLPSSSTSPLQTPSSGTSVPLGSSTLTPNSVGSSPTSVTNIPNTIPTIPPAATTPAVATTPAAATTLAAATTPAVATTLAVATTPIAATTPAAATTPPAATTPVAATTPAAATTPVAATTPAAGTTPATTPSVVTKPPVATTVAGSTIPAITTTAQVATTPAGATTIQAVTTPAIATTPAAATTPIAVTTSSARTTILAGTTPPAGTTLASATTLPPVTAVTTLVTTIAAATTPRPLTIPTVPPPTGPPPTQPVTQPPTQPATQPSTQPITQPPTQLITQATTTRPASQQAQCGVSYIMSTREPSADPFTSAFGEFPWMLALLDATALSPDGRIIRNAFICGASLLNKDIAMTAAHCIKGRPPSSLFIRAGEWNTLYANESIPHQDRSLERVLLHPEFNNASLFNDIALLKLDQPVLYANNVMPICLPNPGDSFVGQNCIATGWGQTAFGPNGRFATRMRKVTLPVLNRTICQTMFRQTRLGPYFNLHDTFLCAGGAENLDTCTGDGGGPLVCKVGNSPTFTQAGIVSWGIGCGQRNVPGAYVDVAAFRGWIDSNIYNIMRDTIPK